MSLRKVLHKTPAFLAVLAFLFLRLGTVDGAVACFGADGHIALEGKHSSASEVRSSVRTLEAVAPTPNLAAEAYLWQQQHSSPCIDVSVAHSGEQYAVGTIGPVSQTVNAVALAPAYVSANGPEAKTTTSFARAPPSGVTSLQFLRTVILLI